MNENRIKRNQLLGGRIVQGLKSRNMNGYYAETKEDALKKALEWIPEGSTVAWGGSMSIAEIGLKKAIIRNITAMTPRIRKKSVRSSWQAMTATFSLQAPML